MNWFIELFTAQSFIQAVLCISLICAVGLALGKIRIFGVSLGATFVFFAGIIAGHFGLAINPDMLAALQNFGLILFIYALGLQVGPGFFSAFKKGGFKMNMLATIERYGKNGNFSLAKCVGYGVTDGAVATSVSHDAHNVVCIGDYASDMALACNFLRELGGGYVIASKGKVLGYFALPAYGLMSERNAEEAMAGIHELELLAYRMGVNPSIDPFITLSFVALPVIPGIRLLDTGLYNVLENKFY